MLTTTMAFFLATQMSLTPASKPVTALPAVAVKIEKIPTLESCWADGQQLSAASKTCVPVTLSAFCREHNWDYGQEHTVSRVLNDLNAHDCEEAESMLRKSRKLAFSSSGVLKIEDIRPLRALPFLDNLNLDGQRVSDLKPLLHLKQLRKLSLRNNEVYDLEPLLEMTNLKSLDITGNPILVNDPILLKLKSRMQVEGPLPKEGPTPEKVEDIGSSLVED